MRLSMTFVRLLAVMSLALVLLGNTSLQTFAQDGTPEAPVDEVTPEPTEEPVVLQGTLTFYVFTCTTGPEGVTGALYAEGEFAPDESCAEEGTAAITVDGGEPEAVGSGGQLVLNEGEYTIGEAVTGAAANVVISADVPAVLYAVFYMPAEVEEGGAPLPTGEILVMKHVCPAEIQTQEDFDALGDFFAKLAACPVITLPADHSDSGLVNGNDPDNPLSFDFTVFYDDNGSEASKTIADASFVAAQVCESEIGQDLNGNAGDDLCFETSHYAYDGITQGAVTVEETVPPSGYRFGAFEFTPGSGDDAAWVSTDIESGSVDLDTTEDDSVMLHIYNFQAPPENRVNIVKHQCDESITTRDDVQAIGDFYDRLAACPVITRGDHEPPAGSIAGGKRTFQFDVEGADGAVQTLDDNATFVPAQLCEADLDLDINGDGDKTDCFSTSRYQFDNVLQGEGVFVTETRAPGGYTYGMVDFDPTTDDAASLVNESTDGVIELDTTLDGEVTLHIFNIAEDVEPTPTPTEEPAEYGSVQIIKLYCLSDWEGAEITVLAPGEEAGIDDLGDDTCIGGDTDFQIVAFGTDYLEPFNVGDDGMIVINDLPVTTDTAPHTIIELFYEVEAEFDIEPDTTTRVIVFNYELEEIDDYEDEEEEYDDEEDIKSGEDLAETGLGPMSGSNGGGGMILFGGLSLILLLGAGRMRRLIA